MAFLQSTQKKHWIFTEEQLKTIRKEVNDRAFRRLNPGNGAENPSSLPFSPSVSQESPMGKEISRTSSGTTSVEKTVSSLTLSTPTISRTDLFDIGKLSPLASPTSLSLSVISSSSSSLADSTTPLSSPTRFGTSDFENVYPVPPSPQFLIPPNENCFPPSPSSAPTPMILSPTTKGGSGMDEDINTEQKEPKYETKETVLPLTLEEEATLQLFYEKEIEEIALSYKFPPSVTATALTYFKRYYVNNTVMDRSPRKIMVACVLLACKAEEAFIKPQQLADHTQIKLEALTKMEVPLLQGLKFHLRVFHPYRPLQGLLFKLKEFDPSVNMEALESRCIKLIQHSLFTDCCLLFLPPHIALAAVLKAAEEQKLGDGIRRSIQTIIASQTENSESQNLSTLLEKIRQIQHFMDRGLAATVDRDACKDIDLKLRKVKNPSFDASSKQFQDAEGKKRAKKEEKRLAKLRKRQDEYDNKVAELTGANSLGEGTSEPFSISRKRLKTPFRLSKQGGQKTPST